MWKNIRAYDLCFKSLIYWGSMNYWNKEVISIQSIVYLWSGINHKVLIIFKQGFRLEFHNKDHIITTQNPS